MSSRLVPKSVTSNDLEQRNGPYFALFNRNWDVVGSVGIGAGLYMYDVVVKKFMFAISSSDEFLVYASCGWELSYPNLR